MGGEKNLGRACRRERASKTFTIGRKTKKKLPSSDQRGGEKGHERTVSKKSKTRQNWQEGRPRKKGLEGVRGDPTRETKKKKSCQVKS